MRNSSKIKNIKVCSGPGCRAWASEKIVRELEGVEMERVTICRVACMKKCGGGATVQVTPSNEVLKMRTFEEALEVLIPESLSPALC
jgi:NADH:ubiquinone oxidoreductase subunit E